VREAKPDFVSVLQREGLEPRKRGASWWLQCPFHGGGAEKTASFLIRNERGHCFSCTWHGDIIDFIKARHGLDFQGALKHAGISTGRLSPEEVKRIEAEKKTRDTKRTLVRRFRDWETAFHSELCARIKDSWWARHEVITCEGTMNALSDIFKNESVWTYRADILESGDDAFKFALFLDLSGGRL